jgi:hypothetical protein
MVDTLNLLREILADLKDIRSDLRRMDPHQPVGTAMMETETLDFLRDLAERLMAVPAIYEIDQGDVDRLLEIARELEDRK